MVKKEYEKKTKKVLTSKGVLHRTALASTDGTGEEVERSQVHDAKLFFLQRKLAAVTAERNFKKWLTGE